MRPIRGCGSPHNFSPMQPASPSKLRGAHNHGWTTPIHDDFPDRLLGAVEDRGQQVPLEWARAVDERQARKAVGAGVVELLGEVADAV